MDPKIYLKRLHNFTSFSNETLGYAIYILPNLIDLRSEIQQRAAEKVTLAGLPKRGKS